MEYDIYDLILEMCGFGNPSLGISQDSLIEHEDEIAALANEIGMEENRYTFNLYLANDNKNDMMEACLTIYNISNQFGFECDIEKAESLMLRTHHVGKCKIAAGSYNKMYQMKLAFKEEGFSSFIMRIEELKK